MIPPEENSCIIIDEVQKIPELLDEVHRLIEQKQVTFILTGSSARKLRQKGVNLLAGRALKLAMHPLTAEELGDHFTLEHSLQYGHLPCAYTEADPQAYLHSYVQTYLKEEVQQEGLTRNLGTFARFLEAASFSQGNILNVAEIARDCSVERKTVENFFTILEDLLIGYRLPIFTKRAKRKMVKHPKFYFFDVGVYRTIRPQGPLDSPEEIEGPALETLFLQEAKAINDNHHLHYDISYWHTSNNMEVDFILYGKRGFKAYEIKRSQHISSKTLRGLKAFMKDYPQAECHLLYGGKERLTINGIHIHPFDEYIKHLHEHL
jgi:predicted AAA+ superfamily ATPase